jgi:anti-sigma-K factor RskA
MTDDRALTRDEDSDLLAAEYVMGVLALEERSMAQARIKTDPAFAAMVAAWEDHLGDLNDQYGEAIAPDHVLSRIEARLFPQEARARRSWLGWLSGAVAAAVLAIAAVIFLAPQPAPDAPVIATLGETGGDLVFEARYDGASLIFAQTGGPRAATGKVHELWIIAPEAAPVSLGLLGDAPLTIPYPMPPVGWTLAVSLEPAGGSTTGAPTGPVLATGIVTDL